MTRRRVVAGILVLAAAAHALAWVRVSESLERQRRATAVLHERVASTRAELLEVRRRLGALDSRTVAMGRALDRVPDPAGIVGAARDSVFSLFAGRSSGTAFVLASGEGRSLLVTNYHVVAGVWPGSRRVELVQDDESHRGLVVDVRPRADLAVVEVAADLPRLERGRSEPTVGDPVVVLGSPLGLYGSVSTGVVSAIRAEGVQFSAPIAPGSSGGPVLDRHGEVIAVASSKLLGRGVEGLAFAVPIERVCERLIDC